MPPTLRKSIFLGGYALIFLSVLIEFYDYVTTTVEDRHLSAKSLLQTDIDSASTTTTYVVPIVVELVGEMGNHLSKLAFGRAIQRLAKSRYNISTKLIVRHEETHVHLVEASKSASNDIQRCFPALRSYNFSEGNTQEYTIQLKQQQEWLRQHTRPELADLWKFEMNVPMLKIDQALETLSHALQTYPLPSDVVQSNATITIPFFSTKRHVPYEFMDKYYDDYRDWFQFDHKACCSLNIIPPYPNETVFHFRNFFQELSSGRAKQLGFEELSPNKTAIELFQSIQPGDHIAITSRFPTHPTTQVYVDALQQNKKAIVRVVNTGTGTSDFCFLQQTQHELVGIARSTFLRWASILGNATLLRWYSVRSLDNIRVFGGSRLFHSYTWNHPELASRLKLEFYNSEDLYDERNKSVN